MINFTAKFYTYGKIHFTAENLDEAIDKTMGHPLIRELHEGQRITIASDASHKVQVITLRRGRGHWKHPGYQFGQIDTRETSGFDNGSQ